MKREEEIAKAKVALERKKKQAEKSVDKAAIRVQKEAEKKLKDQERRVAKKAARSATPANPDEQIEADIEVAEIENVDVNVEAQVPAKAKEGRENTMRYRNRIKGKEPLPRVILKRKKSTPYWVWAAPTVLLVVMLIALGYYYYTLKKK